MGRLTLALLLSSLFVWPTWAQDGSFIRSTEDFEIPEKAEIMQGGFPEAPVLPCPRPAKKYSDLLAQLNEIKTTIQNQACHDSNIQVESLETLITDDRKTFVELIEKGVFGEGQLTDGEVETVKEYVTNVVNYTGNLAGLIKNSACFDKEEKQTTLAFLSNVISEVSGAVGALAGPWGAKISLGGQVAGALLSSIDKIVQARKTYDYDKIEDINNYFNNLCTYYDFKADLDKESNLFVHRERLLEILERSGDYIDKVVQTCEVCELITEDYLTRLNENAGYDLNRVSRVIPTSVSSEFGDSVESPVSPYIAEDGIAAADVSLDEMNDYYARAYAPEIAEEDPARETTVDDEPVSLPEIDTGSFTPRPVTYVAPLPPQEATIRALQVRNWAIEEIRAVENSIRSGIGEDGRLAVAQLQRDIENFLVDDEAPDYIRHKTRDLRGKISQLQQLAMRQISATSMINPVYRVPRDPNYDYEYDYRDASGPVRVAFHDLFRNDYDFASILMEQAGYPESAAQGHAELREELKRNLVQALSDMVDAHGVLQRKCEFFTTSLLNDHRNLVYTCERAQRTLDVSLKIATELKSTSFAERNSFTLSLVYEKRPNYVSDWVASVNYSLLRDIEQLQ